MPTTKAAYALSQERAGTFLVRFANSRVSDFAMSRVYPTEGYIHHLHILHPVNEAVFSLFCDDIDTSRMSKLEVASLRCQYSSLEDLVQGVSEALRLEEPLVSIPRLLLGQNVKHNGYFVRAFHETDSEDEDLHKSQNESPVNELEELEEQGIVTPLRSKDYRRTARILGLNENIHSKLSTSSNKSLLMEWTDFCGLCLWPNIVAAKALGSEDYSQTLVTVRAKSLFRLNLFALPMSKSFNRSRSKPSSPTPDCSGLLSSLCFIQFGLASDKMVKIVFSNIIDWLRGNETMEYFGRPIHEWIASKSSWKDYVDSLSNQSERWGDIMIMIAFAELYSISIICVTDFEFERRGQIDLLEHTPCVFCIEASRGMNFAILGITGGGLTYHPLLPQTFFEALRHAGGK